MSAFCPSKAKTRFNKGILTVWKFPSLSAMLEMRNEVFPLLDRIGSYLLHSHLPALPMRFYLTEPCCVS
jgi:hypothetical protein